MPKSMAGCNDSSDSDVEQQCGYGPVISCFLNSTLMYFLEKADI